MQRESTLLISMRACARACSIMPTTSCKGSSRSRTPGWKSRRLGEKCSRGMLERGPIALAAASVHRSINRVSMHKGGQSVKDNTDHSRQHSGRFADSTTTPSIFGKAAPLARAWIAIASASSGMAERVEVGRAGAGLEVSGTLSSSTSFWKRPESLSSAASMWRVHGPWRDFVRFMSSGAIDLCARGHIPGILVMCSFIAAAWAQTRLPLQLSQMGAPPCHPTTPTDSHLMGPASVTAAANLFGLSGTTLR